MDRKLSKYLHLYIGCQVEYEGILNGKELKAELDANKHDVFYVPKIKEEKGKKIGYLREVCYRQNSGYSKCKVGRKSLKSYWGDPCIKLVLRPLSSMTEEEAFELAKLSEYEPHFNDVKIERGKFDNDIIVTWQGSNESRERFNATGELFYCADQFLWLLKNHFDLFHLIEDGLAIDSTTLKTLK